MDDISAVSIGYQISNNVRDMYPIYSTNCFHFIYFYYKTKKENGSRVYFTLPVISYLKRKKREFLIWLVKEAGSFLQIDFRPRLKLHAYHTPTKMT